ncbi:restriction endonuclease [Candidatus Saccharibacteria bacterium]|nr:restriction endonuclease [Candidatus Saccharibacteria bacterium]
MFKIINENFVFPYRQENDALKKTILKSLLDNGFAQIENDECVVPFLSIYELDSFELSLLGLPKYYPYSIFLDGNGVLTTPKFDFKVSFRAFDGGDIFPKIELNGPIVKLKIRDELVCYLLTNAQIELISVVNEFNSLPAKRDDVNLKYLSKIQVLAEKAGAILSTTLKNREVSSPLKVTVHLEDGEIQPVFGSQNDEEFSRQIDSGTQVKDLYSARRDNKSSYLTLNDKTKKVVEEIKEIRKCANRSELQKIAAHPEEYFDPEYADLSEFYSERVIGIGLYEPKVYPFISPYKSEWVPSFTIEDRTNGTKNLIIRSIDELSALEASINQAKKEGKKYFDFNGVNLTISNAEQIAGHAKEILAKKEKVTKEGEGSVEEKKKETTVLLIEDNMEMIGFNQSTGKMSLPKQADLKIDSSLKGEIKLKNHQQEGVAWLQYCLDNAKGVLLGDDMGLGKTLQVLYLIDWHYRNAKGTKPYLVVAPVSLLENWENEYKKFFNNGMEVQLINRVPTTDDSAFIQEHSHEHIMLMSYECMRRGQLTIGKIDFAIIVLDEAQKIKEPGTMVTNAAKALKGDFKVAMTGTPVENTFMNLWCIMDFAVPGYLGTAKEFAKKYQAPLRNPQTDIQQLGEKLHGELGGYFLRRLKCDVAKELPSKHIEPKECKMPQEQLERYLLAIEMDGCPAPGDALRRLQELRRISDHPYLDERCWEDYSNDELIESSAKLKATMDILKGIQAKGEKVIVFTERRDMQRMLQRIFLDKYALTVSVINGETSATSKGNNLSRQKTIDNFQEKPGFNIIIMSQLAAGIGLNVTGANHVIHYSRHWNPAKENQATDRVYRIGQTKDVFIYYPMAVSDKFETFDKVLNDLLNRKMNLANASLYPTDQIEVKVDDLGGKIFGGNYEKTSNRLVTDADMDTMDDYLFESFVAVVYSKRNYNSRVTPKSGDKGVDVLAVGSDAFAIQCKHGKTIVGNDAVQEIVAGARYYEMCEKTPFKPCVVTNSEFGKQAKDLARANNVELIDGKMLRSMLTSALVTWRDVYEMERSRMK